MGAEPTDEAREHALNSAHCDEREMDDPIPDTDRLMSYFVAQEHTEIHVCEDEFYAGDCSVETFST